MGFLEILGIYGLVGEFDRDDLLELFEVVAVRDRAPELCRVLELEEKMPVLGNSSYLSLHNSSKNSSRRGGKFRP
uniref:FRIGIDA-like protein n=1 Tax=Vitis vinifera TaxID=29760 RepID=F6HTY7_VITVI